MKRDKKEFHRQENSNIEDDSSSSEDDENAELLTEELEEGFYKVLSQLKKKDSKLYEESIHFFPGNSSEGDGVADLNTEKTNKKTHKDYREWLKGRKEKVKNEKIKENLEALHDFWTNPSLNKDEQFLRDYILNKKFLDPDDSFNIEEEISKLSDEEREVEEQLLFEHKYNCRFENPDQELLIKEKSKSKRKKNDVGKEVLLHEHDDSLYHDISPNSRNVESNEEETKKETTNNKKKKKKNKFSDNKIFEEREESNKVENFKMKEEDKETLAGAKNINSESVKGISQADTYTSTKTYQDVNSFKRKRRKRNSVQSNEDKYTLNIIRNVDINQSGMLNSKKKSKKKRSFDKIESSDTKEVRENVNIVLPQNEKKLMNNLPRNLQIKNKKGIKKLRHRNMKKALWMKMNNRVPEETVGKVKDHTGGLSKKMKKKKVHYNSKNVGDSKNKNNFQTKINTHFQNPIMKEKKIKELKFGKMRSKKQKAANVVGKS